MINIDFNNIKELEAHFNKVALQALQTTVLEKIKDIMVEEIQTEVYDAYKSNAKYPYERTGKLKKRDNIKGYIVNGHQMMVINERGNNRENGMDIGTILETGKGYTWQDSEIYKSQLTRPFYKTTTYRIKGTNLKDIINALKIGLKVGGLDLV